jgi:hypothetical protein
MSLDPSGRAAVALCLLLGAGRTIAQPAGYPAIDLDRFTPPPMAEGAIGAATAEAGAAGSWRVALAAQLLSRPLLLDDAGRLRGGGYGATGNRATLVTSRAEAWLTGAFAPVDGFELHGALPVVLVQDGQNLTGRGFGLVDAGGLGSPRVGARWTILSRQERGGWSSGWPLSVAVAADAVLPFGSDGALASDRWAMVAPRLELAVGEQDGVVAMELGARLRSHGVRFQGEGPGAVVLRHELEAALVVAGSSDPLRAEFSVRGQLAPGSSLASIQTLVGVRLRTGPSEVFLAAGPAFKNLPGTPELRALFGVAWLPPRD